MIVPAKRLSRARSHKRRFQKEKIKLPQLQKCKNCSALILPHRVCPECGFYRGRFIMSFKKENKKEKKKA
ncbi:MAG: 50S ribosomal protein L32 [Patescibacteria group bacterium]|nr:50S ribosomal protein L32 [Patescibacteria group bacterium]